MESKKNIEADKEGKLNIWNGYDSRYFFDFGDSAATDKPYGIEAIITVPEKPSANISLKEDSFIWFHHDMYMGNANTEPTVAIRLKYDYDDHAKEWTVAPYNNHDQGVAGDGEFKVQPGDKLHCNIKASIPSSGTLQDITQWTCSVVVNNGETKTWTVTMPKPGKGDWHKSSGFHTEYNSAVEWMKVKCNCNVLPPNGQLNRENVQFTDQNGHLMKNSSFVESQHSETGPCAIASASEKVQDGIWVVTTTWDCTSTKC